MLRPWATFLINDCGEPLLRIPSSIYCLEPHPYQSLGAPYGGSDPFCLRRGIINRLLIAQNELKLKLPGFQLAVFDAWRPVQVQAFMVEHSINQECIARGIDRNEPKQAFEVQEIVNEVAKFWAPPTNAPSNPPPHSTGGAIDITIADGTGYQIDMGGDIDAIGSISEPNYYLDVAIRNPASPEALFHERRNILAEVMLEAGFVQHPNEWWHFSYGDQLWAWRAKKSMAIYGSCSGLEESKDVTA